MATTVADKTGAKHAPQAVIDAKFREITDGIAGDFSQAAHRAEMDLAAQRAQAVAQSPRTQRAVGAIEAHRHGHGNDEPQQPGGVALNGQEKDKEKDALVAGGGSDDSDSGINHAGGAKVLAPDIGGAEVTPQANQSAVHAAALTTRQQWRDSTQHLGVSADLVGSNEQHMNGTGGVSAVADKGRESTIDRVVAAGVDQDIQGWLDHERNTRASVTNPTTDVATNNAQTAQQAEAAVANTVAGKEAAVAKAVATGKAPDDTQDKKPKSTQPAAKTGDGARTLDDTTKAGFKAAENAVRGVVGGNKVGGAKSVPNADAKSPPAAGAANHSTGREQTAR